ncbi:hypothetical protein ACFQ51_22445 [Streptomyces kaempferi]
MVLDQCAPYVEGDVVARDAPPAGADPGQRGQDEILGLLEVTGEQVRGADQAGPGRGGVRREVASTAGCGGDAAFTGGYGGQGVG